MYKEEIRVWFCSPDGGFTQAITGALGPGFGALNPTDYTAMLNEPLPEKIWFYPIHAERGTATFQALDAKFSVEIPLHPFLGCIGVAPAGGEARSSIVPAEFGGAGAEQSPWLARVLAQPSSVCTSADPAPSPPSDKV